jgi:hypothetical protein
MFTQSDVQILAEQLPDRAVYLIKKKTKISRPTINKFFRGEKVRSGLAQEIYTAALTIIARNNNREDKLREKSSRILRPKTH